MPKLTISKKPFKGKPVGAEIDLTDQQARLLTKLGRAQYMTRDMVAAPVQVVQQTAEPSFELAGAAASPQPQAQAEAVDDLDSSGAAWDERVHSNTKARNADGTWRKRPGPRSAEE